MEETNLAATSAASRPLPFIPSGSPGLRPAPAAGPRRTPASLPAIAHDARNLVTALKLCSELIAEPGVLTAGNEHFAEEVLSIAAASEHIVRRLSVVARTATPEAVRPHPGQPRAGQPDTEMPVEDLSLEVRQLRGLLAAVAGPAIRVEVATLPCAGRLALSEESLTRILLNLVRNAADAMPAGGSLRITTQRGGGGSFFWTVPSSAEELQFADEAHGAASTVVLCVEDDGPGIPAELAERVFEPGFSTHRGNLPWPDTQHHGLGLSIVRQLVEQAGGAIQAVVPRRRGARFEIELPLTNVTPPLPSDGSLWDGGGLR